MTVAVVIIVVVLEVMVVLLESTVVVFEVTFAVATLKSFPATRLLSNPAAATKSVMLNFKRSEFAVGRPGGLMTE